MFRRLSGSAPRTYHPFSAAGADAEGVVQSGGVPHGADLCDQPHFRQRFGEGSFEVRDATVLSDLLCALQLWNPMFISASAPCQGYSTADVQNLSEAPRLIFLMRDHLCATGRLYMLWRT